MGIIQGNATGLPSSPSLAQGVRYEVLKRGVTWDWESFPSYMQAAGRRGCAINLSFLAPLTPFRHYVMGEESMDRAATAQETEKIAALLREAVAAGALGFSHTTGIQHVGYKGRPLACRLADRSELGAYARVLRELGKGVIEITLTQNFGHIQDHELDLLSFLLDESGRRVTWLAIFDREDQPHIPVVERRIAAQRNSIHRVILLSVRRAQELARSRNVQRHIALQLHRANHKCPRRNQHRSAAIPRARIDRRLQRRRIQRNAIALRTKCPDVIDPRAQIDTRIDIVLHLRRSRQTRLA